MPKMGKIFRQNYGNTPMKNDMPKPLTRIEKQQTEYEQKGYYRTYNRGTFGVKNYQKHYRSPYAKGDFEIEKDYQKRIKKYSSLQRQQGISGAFKPDLD